MASIPNCQLVVVFSKMRFCWGDSSGLDASQREVPPESSVKDTVVKKTRRNAVVVLAVFMVLCLETRWMYLLSQGSFRDNDLSYPYLA